MGLSMFGTEDDRCCFFLLAIAAASEPLGVKNAVIEAKERRFLVIRDVAVSRRRGFPGGLMILDPLTAGAAAPNERELGEPCMPGTEVCLSFGDPVGEISGEVEGVNRPNSVCPTDIVSPELDEDVDPRY